MQKQLEMTIPGKKIYSYALWCFGFWNATKQIW